MNEKNNDNQNIQLNDLPLTDEQANATKGGPTPQSKRTVDLQSSLSTTTSAQGSSAVVSLGKLGRVE